MEMVDKLSNMPDSIIHEVLSRLETTKEAVKTCVLSKDWTRHWSHVHSLSIDYKDFYTTTNSFEKFVLHVLQHRHHSTRLRKLKLFCRAKRNRSLINRVFEHATSHGIEELQTDVCDFPPSLMECQTLRTLHLGCLGSFIHLSSNLNFPRLRNLQLSRVDIHNGHDDLFSGCSSLEKLELTSCSVFNTKIFDINAPQLVELVIRDLKYDGLIGIFAPKLKRINLEGIKFVGMFPLVNLRIYDFSVLDIVKLEMTYPLISQHAVNWWEDLGYSKEEFIDCMVGMTKLLRAQTKNFTFLFNFYAGEIKILSNSSNGGTEVLERKNEFILTDLPWN